MLVLRESSSEMTRPADRRELYLFAARVLERARSAIAALEGRL